MWKNKGGFIAQQQIPMIHGENCAQNCFGFLSIE